MDIKVTLEQEEYRVLESWLGIGMVEPWIQHALNNKIRQRLDATILEETDRNPKKLTKTEKFKLIKNLTLMTREERDSSNKGEPK